MVPKYTQNRNTRSIWAARAEGICTGSCRSIGCFQIAVPRFFVCILVTVWNIEMGVGFLETRMFVLLNNVVSFQKIFDTFNYLQESNPTHVLYAIFSL